MRTISRRRLREFWEVHADAERPLQVWYAIVNGRSYRSPHEVRADFTTASFLGGSRTVFNIGGNKYRLVVDIRYDLQRIYIREVLTHQEYDRKTQQGTLWGMAAERRRHGYRSGNLERYLTSMAREEER